MARLRDRVIAILCATVGLGTPLCFADGSDFVPRALRNGAYFDLFASHEIDENRNVAQPYDWRDTFLRERITLFSDGYVYHPRFLQYHASIGAALKQEDYAASYQDPMGWSYGHGFDYEVRLFFLSEHPANVELFALRYEPLYREYAALQPNTVETTEGVSFQYRQNPYRVHSRYTVDKIESGFASTTVETLGLDGEYFKHFGNGNQLSFTAAFIPSHYETSQDLEGDKSQYLLGNVIDLKTVRLFSSLNRNDYSQEGALTGRSSTDQFSWYELLNVIFPHNLRTNLTYQRQNNESTFPDPFLGERELSDDIEDIRLDVLYRLFQSLDVTYSWLDNSRTSSAGNTKSTFNSLTLNYTKIVPVGRVLVGTTFGRISTDNAGTTDVALEPHSGKPVPGPPFALIQPNVTPGSVALFFKSPVSPFNNIPLIEGIHYTLAVVGNLTEVTMLSVPAPFFPGTYDLFASYSLATGDFSMDSRTTGFSASVELFDQMLIPYYSYVTISSDVTQGIFPGIPPDSTANTLGVRYQKGPWRALGEYQDLDWAISPYRAFRAEMQYVGPVNPTTSFYGTGQYLHRYFTQGNTFAPSEPYTYQTVSATGTLQKAVPSQGLTFSVGATVSRTVGLVDTNAYSLNSAMAWNIGKLTLTAGANAYAYDNTGGLAAETSRMHQYYYVMLRRVLF